MTGFTYDAGALIAAEAGDPHMWRRHRDALEQGLLPTVPAAVLAQVWRGGPQALLSRFLTGCEIETLDDVRARAAGELCALSRTADTTDAAVVVGAVARRDVVVTSDRRDIRRLAAALGAKVETIAV